MSDTEFKKSSKSKIINLLNTEGKLSNIITNYKES